MPYNENEIPEFLNLWKDIADVIRFTGYITDKQPDMSVLPGVKMGKVPSRVPCKQIYRDIVIRANGDVTPCVITSESPQYISMGNVFRDGGIQKVWNGEKFKEGETFIINLNGETYLIVRDVIIGLKVMELKKKKLKTS